MGKEVSQKSYLQEVDEIIYSTLLIQGLIGQWAWCPTDCNRGVQCSGWKVIQLSQIRTSNVVQSGEYLPPSFRGVVLRDAQLSQCCYRDWLLGF